MPFEFEVKDKTKHIEVKYDDNTLEAKHEDFIKCREWKMKTNSDSQFMMGCITGGLGVAAIGVTCLILKRPINLRAFPFARKSAIFEVTIPSDHENDFEEYVDGKLIAHLQIEFENIMSHLAVLGVTTGYSDYQDMIIKQLKEVKITSVKICSQEIAEKAFEDMYKKEAFDKQRRKQCQPPKNLIIREGPKSPSTQIFVSYDTVMGADGYTVTAHDLGSGKKIEKSTVDGFCIVDCLKAGHSYLLGVKTLCNGLESSEILAEDHVRTAMYDPYPWRYIDTRDAGAEYMGYTEGDGCRPFRVDDDLPKLWTSSLHVELRKIFGKRFNYTKMKSLLLKCDELGITEASDLMFLKSKEVAEQFKGMVKMIELLKLIEYAKDQYGTSTQESTYEKRSPSIVINSDNSPMATRNVVSALDWTQK